MMSINDELTKGEKEYLDLVMKSNGYSLWDVTEAYAFYCDRNDSGDEATHLVAFNSWKSAYDYARKIADNGRER